MGTKHKSLRLIASILLIAAATPLSVFGALTAPGGTAPSVATCFKNLDPYLYIALIPPAATDDMPAEVNEIKIIYSGSEVITPQTTIIYSINVATDLAPKSYLTSEEDESKQFAIEAKNLPCSSSPQLSFFTFNLPTGIPSGTYQLQVGPLNASKSSAVLKYIVSNLKVVTNITLTGNGLGGSEPVQSGHGETEFETMSPAAGNNNATAGCSLDPDVQSEEMNSSMGMILLAVTSLMALLLRQIKQQESRFRS